MAAPWASPDWQPEPELAPTAAPAAALGGAPAQPVDRRIELPVPLGRLTVADRLDGALRILKLAPASVIALTAAAVAPFELLAAATLQGEDDPFVRTLFGAPLTALFTDDTGGGSVAPLLFLLLDTIAIGVVAAGLASLVTGWYVGRRTSTVALLRTALSRLPVLAVAMTLSHLVQSLFGIVAFVGALLPMIWWAVVAPVIGAEGVGPLAALRRSFRLTTRAYGAVLTTCLMVAAASFVLRLALGAAASVYAGLGWPAAWAVATAAAVGARLVTVPLVAGSAVLLYLDLRVRNEGLDIDLAVSEKLGVKALGPLVVALVLVAAPTAGAEPPAPVHDPEAVRELADEILTRDEFQPPEPTLLERIGDWIGDHLVPGDSDGGGSSIEAPAAGAGGSSVLTSVLLVLAIAGVGYVLWLVLRQPRRRSRAEEDPETEIEEHRTASEWEAAARQHEAAGRWKDGLRCRFRALVEALADSGFVPELAGRTSGELRADLATSLPEATAEFDLAAGLFEAAWYGDLPTGPDESGRFAGAATAILARAAERRVPLVPAAPDEPVEVGV